ncbi:hypothetical protein Pmani_002822 [Petrolisthes manimaculis]|uniref:5' exonuclease Apollo n=1 Tax=Petrolisthes manimaculis TaxID=1843537 RepID=A0AAE1QHS5_9EUCA|nr:hypothetical protein Pmani_002822 [Petrolisthes manimaculis]
MNGCVIQGTPIAVDFWKPTKAPQVRLFFLTHLHADHTQGLTSSWRLPIYTSPTNAVLLKHKFKLSGNIVRELEVRESYLIPLDDDGDHTITVTVLDANHVPGAVMFLFQGYFGNILYSGDMRWYPELVEDPVLREVVVSRQLDRLYLDNTFSAPYCTFPSRQKAKQELFTIIDSFPDHIIKVGIRELGREDLLESVARRFQERILVTQSKFEYLQLLNYSDAFTTDSDKARIHAVPMTRLNVSSHRKWNEEHPTISIILTALFVGWENGPYSSQSDNGMFIVPYSDHSSYSELMEMVAQLAPRQIIPIVQHWSKAGWWSDPNSPDQSVKADMSVYSHFLTCPLPDPVIIPEAVVELMHQGPSKLLSRQPRRCGLRKGLSPRRNSVRGVQYCTPEHLSSPPTMIYSPSLGHMSMVTLGTVNQDFVPLMNRTPSPSLSHTQHQRLPETDRPPSLCSFNSFQELKSPSTPLSHVQHQYMVEASTPTRPLSVCSLNSKEVNSPNKNMSRSVLQKINNQKETSRCPSSSSQSTHWTQVNCQKEIHTTPCMPVPLQGNVENNVRLQKPNPDIMCPVTENVNFFESKGVSELKQSTSHENEVQISLITNATELIKKNYSQLSNKRTIDEDELSGLVRSTEEIFTAISDLHSTL